MSGQRGISACDRYYGSKVGLVHVFENDIQPRMGKGDKITVMKADVGV